MPFLRALANLLQALGALAVAAATLALLVLQGAWLGIKGRWYAVRSAQLLRELEAALPPETAPELTPSERAILAAESAAEGQTGRGSGRI